MSIRLFDPVGDMEVVQRKGERPLDTLKGKAVGYVFNQHISAIAFWKNLERCVEGVMEPSRTYRIYKPNTWAPAPKQEVERLAQETDYALVGVGA